MQVLLSPQLQRFVKQLVAEGDFGSSDAVIEAALKAFTRAIAA
jgi:putative addiction module CopG family antidote